MTLKSLIVASAIFLGGCSGITHQERDTESAPYAGYIAINPISLPNGTIGEFSLTSAEIQRRKSEKRIDQDLEFLINNAARISIKEIDENGSVNYLSSGVTSKNSYYHSTIDYIKYHSSSIKLPVEKNVNGEYDFVIIGVAVGVGLRAEASFTANESGINIADIINIGASAQSKKISGSMAFQTMGIESKAISDTLPIPSELSTSTIQNALQTMATVKANIYSHETNVIPQIVGIEIQNYPEGVTVSDIIKAIHTNKSMLSDQVRDELSQYGAF
ncbi:hypothetical protein [Vibrio bathopelagicus]|uniref:hypothetical protein n=1 Tax=Vibrio bathopelagicus TaxID=2777577 RepID=UPI001863A792|nr:hypothetical protein [Vibrio bathopelagicus]